MLDDLDGNDGDVKVIESMRRQVCDGRRLASQWRDSIPKWRDSVPQFPVDNPTGARIFSPRFTPARTHLLEELAACRILSKGDASLQSTLTLIHP